MISSKPRKKKGKERERRKEGEKRVSFTNRCEDVVPIRSDPSLYRKPKPTYQHHRPLVFDLYKVFTHATKILMYFSLS